MLASQIGINLTFDSDYGTDESLSYKNTVADQICGDNNDPRWASQVRTL